MAVSAGSFGTMEFGTAIMAAARIAFLLVGIASTAAIIASIVVPYSTDLLYTSLPRIRIIASSFLSPSYLFITVHFIIIVIWKLQGNNHMPQSAEQEKGEIEEAEIQYEIKPPDIPGDDSPINTAISVSDPADSAPDPADSGTSAIEDAQDTMDATWKTIVERDAAAAAAAAGDVRPRMRKSDTWERCNREFSPPPPAAAALEGRFRKSNTFRRASVGRDELFGRAEAFIRTHYEQRRIQRQESEQRFAEMVNAAC